MVFAYLAMSAYCERINFTGCATWLRIQSQEEHVHAMKLFDFLLARGASVQLKALNGPRNDFGSVVEVFNGLRIARNSASPRRSTGLYEVAFDQKAFDTVVQTQWFINEQVEEEKTIREIVARMQMVKDNPASLLDMDRDLGSRTPEAEGGPEAT